MAKVWFDFSAATNGDGTSPSSPKNTIAGYTFVSGDEHYFRRGGVYNGAMSLVAGTSGKPTKYNSWYNADGTDDQSKAKPIFNLTTVLSSYASTNKDWVSISSLDLRNNGVAVAADTYLVFLGAHSGITNCNVDTNVGGIGAYGKSNVTIAYNTVSAVSHPDSVANDGIGASDSLDVTNVSIIGNTVVHKGGGGTNANCHGIRADSLSATTNRMRNLTVRGNTVSPPTGTSICGNHQAIGIRLQNCPDAEVSFNTVTGMRSGIFLTGGGQSTGIHVHHNKLQYNLNFGIHMTSDTNGSLIEYNDCSFNGTNINDGTTFAYGRGIELSSAAGQGKCANHVIRFNVCKGNINYGGNTDNGSEGVGLGFDDYTSMCVAYGNVFQDNEGNGVQYYGGDGSNASITDTGGNHCVANFFQNNCKASFKNRRTGGTFKTAFCSHISVAATFGTKSVIANNVMLGGDAGIRFNSLTDKAKVVVANNIFLDIPHCIVVPDSTGLTCYNNVFYSDTVSVQKYALNGVDANGVSTFGTIAFNGINDYITDPILDGSSFRPLANSPSIGAGYNCGNFRDYTGKPFGSTPNVGMFSNHPSPVAAFRL